MALTFAFFNIGPQQIIMLGFLGLLLFGKDLPMIARNAARQYYFYKKKFAEATADLRREMDNAASVIEEEKRKIQSEIAKDMPTLEDKHEPFPPDPDAPPTADPDPNFTPAAEIPAPGAAVHPTSAPPPKPAADPLSLDVPVPSTLTHRATEAAKSTTDRLSELDSLKSVPPPKTPPPPAA